jgi:UDP-N-acetylglucosamine:LPS N-acetylglucosamine transferase
VRPTAEFALQQLACVLVPSKQLGWNVRNAAALAAGDAVVVLDEDQAEQPERLGRTVGELLEDGERRAQLARALAGYAHPNAAAELADLLLTIAGGQKHVAAKK